MTIKISVVQIDVVVGDFPGNLQRILDYVQQARSDGADLLLLPELVLSGYPADDFLLRHDFYETCRNTLNLLAEQTEDLAILAGFPLADAGNGRFYNAAALLYKGRIQTLYRKFVLSDDEGCDEKRYFDRGDEVCVFDLEGVRCGVVIGADLWRGGLNKALRTAGAELVFSLNASPYYHGRAEERVQLASMIACDAGMPILYVNLVGGQDELVFDGGSFAVGATGQVTWRAPLFCESSALLEFKQQESDNTFVVLSCNDIAVELPLDAEIYQALTVGLRGYVEKNNFRDVVIGLSGGIDSALVAAIAVDALGSDRVHTLMLSSPYTAQMSIDDARLLASQLGVRHLEIPIDAVMTVFSELLTPIFAQLPPDTQDITEENIQARIRGLLLMAYSNRSGSLVLTTGNKSEMAVGYTTLYGDMAGGFAVLKDVVKTMVYRLALFRNTLAPVIPERIITRPPSAELKHEQTDQDNLPPYELLDKIIMAYVEDNLGRQELLAQGLPADEVDRVIHLLYKSEYKRRQAPPGIRVTRRGFGNDWHFPITHRFNVTQLKQPKEIE